MSKMSKDMLKAKLNELIVSGIPTNPLPNLSDRDNSVPHAPALPLTLTNEQFKLAVRNALRYFPKETHKTLTKEFTDELKQYGHIYMYRFRPVDIEIKAYPLDWYQTKTREGAAIIAMIMNNLNYRVAQYPHELVTYGGNGQVFSNWAQFRLVLKYLAEMSEEQTLVLYSGHPLGLFPSTSSSPRMTITNGMVIPNYSKREDYSRLFALGVSQYGQMTAGSFCYIGPQGIVHGTTLTLLNAGRKYLDKSDLRGTVFLTSGLGGMSGAQAKAAVICGCVGVIAEVSMAALKKRHEQSWLDRIVTNLDELVELIRASKMMKSPISIGYHGNIVCVWDRMVLEYEKTGDMLIDLASDQTSLHAPYTGGYYPYQLTYEESNDMIKSDPEKFKELVQRSLRSQVRHINKMSKAGTKFWDYGNAFLLEADRAGADVGRQETAYGVTYGYPSYVQHIMGDIFSLGFGPFRWVCMSQDSRDLDRTDEIAKEVIEKLLEQKGLDPKVKGQYEDNLLWITEAKKHGLVVGSQARILYSDQVGRIAIALAFNEAVRTGKLSAPVVISRDHHDVSGADSPFRETSNIYDGSNVTADMATQNYVGDAIRGATWVALHNGGGVGWGEVINGGFGLLLDGKESSANRARSVLNWDVSNGVARRAWSGNDNANESIRRAMDVDDKLQVTLANQVEDELINELNLDTA